LGAFEFAQRLIARINLRRSTAAASRQTGEGFERGARAAEVINEGPKRPGADILSADEPQPIEALLIRQPKRFCCLAHAAP
jgi:hypothetical protein